MRKIVFGITGAVVLLLAGILTWNAEATGLIGATTVHTGTSHSLVEKAGCGEDEVDDVCEKGSMIACSKGTSPQSPNCTCDACPPGNTFPGCPCRAGTSCNFLGKWYRC